MRRANAIFGRARYDRRRAISICESRRFIKLVGFPDLLQVKREEQHKWGITNRRGYDQHRDE